jgi:hypothetical protein
MTFEALQTLVDYHYWARDRLLLAVEALPDEQLRQPLGNSFSSVFDTVVHLCGADWIWRSRWEGVSPMALPKPDSYGDLAQAAHPRDPRAPRPRGHHAADRVSGLGRPLAGAAVLADAAARGEPRLVPSRPGHHHAAAVECAAAEDDGSDRLLP